MDQAAGCRTLRAPQQDGQTLIDPSLDALPEAVNTNRQQLAALVYDMQGRSLAALKADARQGLLRAATTYTAQYRDVPAGLARGQCTADRPLILSGHQPQLFHPGVWYKNFVLGDLACRLGGAAVHLLIDSDLCRGASIRVPMGTVQHPHVEALAYDRPSAEVPYEERTVNDETMFARFGERVGVSIAPLVADPLVRSMWPMLMGLQPDNRNLGLWLARGRHAYEASWQNETLELPLSAVCQLPEFAWYAAHLLAQLPRFRRAHNDALAEFRRLHRIHNRAQPIPDLAANDDWLEAPLWIWSKTDPRRRALFARRSGAEIVLSDRSSQSIRLAITPDGDANRASEQLADLSARGIKIRTRALTTTMFARLVLGDLFLHGIGGARYDQVTNQIAMRFLGFALPAFATVSATLRLPIVHEPVNAGMETCLRQQLREMRFHPERFLEQDGVLRRGRPTTMDQVIATKQHWINIHKTPENARQRHVAIAEANLALQPLLHEARERVERQRAEIAARRRASAILDSREYAFCLFPRRHIESLLQSGLRGRNLP